MKKRVTITICFILLICALLAVSSLFGCKQTSPRWYTGSGQPKEKLGADKDHYSDETNDRLYVKLGGVWATLPNGENDYAIMLPNTVYLSAGQELEIYFKNITSYDVSAVLVGSNMPNSKMYSDKWVGTPKSAGTYTLAVSLCDSGKIVSSKRVDIVVRDGLPKDKNVLVIGDSTVYMGIETLTFLDESRKDNASINLLGTMFTENGSNRFEGRIGWTASNYVYEKEINNVSNAFFNPAEQKFDFSYYMKKQSYAKADAVFIQLGINDVFNAQPDNPSQSAKTYISAMEHIVSDIRHYDPDTSVIINPVIPCIQTDDEDFKIYGILKPSEYMRNMYMFNAALFETFSDTPNVYVSYYHAVFDASRYVPENIHPDAEGYAVLGRQMYRCLKALLATRSPN